MFGALLIISLFELEFIMRQFKLLKTFTGRGFFNLFLASMFLVGNDGEVYAYLMVGGLCFFGLLSIMIGCACISETDKKSALKRNTDTSEADASLISK